MAAPSRSLVGDVIDGRYEILDQIGAGGVGVVYRARRLKLDRLVAIKVLHESLTQDPNFMGRFQREALALSQLYHPHCVAVTDLGVHQGRPYLVIEYVPGETLSKLAAMGRFDPVRAIRVALQLLETLEYFHQHHIVHRDLKGENVMLVPSSASTEFVKVLDFGMAKILQGRGADSELSMMGVIPGTPSAMAPEQIQQLPPDPRIDIYATGILLYEMIVGERPFRGPDMEAVLSMQLRTPPRPPREILGEGAMSAELEDVILKALEKDPTDRFASAADMAAALRRTPEGGGVSLPEPVPTERGSSPPGEAALLRRRRRLWLRVGVAAAAVVAFVGLVVLLKVWLAAPRPRVMAEAAPPDAAPPPSQPVPVADPWRAHRDLAVTYARRDQPREAFEEVQTAVRDNPAAAAADPALVDVAITRLALPDGDAHVAGVVQAFRSNPLLVERLAAASLSPNPATRRHVHAALTRLGAADRIDQVAAGILDVDQATTCHAMKDAFRELLAAAPAGDQRVTDYVNVLRSRGRRDPHVKCLRRALRKLR